MYSKIIRKEDTEARDMKVLLAYAGKNGTTKICAERLHQHLRGKDVTVVNLDEETPIVERYDLIVVGSAVYFGKLRPAVRRFLRENEEKLLQKSLAFFLCCGLTEEYEYYREKLFSKPLREHAFQRIYFGGSLRTDGLSFFDKITVKMMRSSIFEKDIENGEYTVTLPSVLPENIDKMAADIREELIRLFDEQNAQLDNL